MATLSTFKAFAEGRDFVRGSYYKSSDVHKLSKEELEEILSYKDIREEFEYYNYYGAHFHVVCILESVKLDGHYLVFTVTTNRDIPKHYIPCPFQILNKKEGLLYPISVSRE